MILIGGGYDKDKRGLVRHGNGAPKGQEDVTEKVNSELEKIKGKIIDIKFQYYTAPNGATGTFAWIIYQTEE